MDNTEAPEVLAVVPLPTAQERRRREIMLARVMLVAIDIVLAGEPRGLETTRDLVQSLWTNSDDLHWMALACVQY